MILYLQMYLKIISQNTFLDKVYKHFSATYDFPQFPETTLYSFNVKEP